MHPLIESLGIKKLPIGVTEKDLVQNILHDSFLNMRCQELMVKYFGGQAAKQMLPVEIEHFVKRLGCGPVAAQKVTWNVYQAPISGQWAISAKVYGEDACFTGPSENVRLFKFHGEFCPSHICEEYAEHYKPMGFSQDAQQHGHFEQNFKK